MSIIHDFSLFADLAPLCLREADELPILLDRSGRALGAVRLVWSSAVDALFPRLDAVSAVVIVPAVIALYDRGGLSNQSGLVAIAV